MHTVRKKLPLINRAQRIAGQVNAVENALRAEKDCAAVMQSVAAIRGAMDSLLAEILEEHIRFHVLSGGERGREARGKGADQVADVIPAYLG